MLSKESKLSSTKTKQTVLGLTPIKRTASGEQKNIESKTLDSTIASFFYENALAFHVADSQSFSTVVEQCIEFGQQHPGARCKAPNRRRIGDPLLESACEETAATVQPIVARANKCGGTVACSAGSAVLKAVFLDADSSKG